MAATSDVEVIVHMMEQIKKVLGGVISQPHHKLAVIDTIEAVREGIQSKSRSSISAVVAIAVEILEKYANKVS